MNLGGSNGRKVVERGNRVHLHPKSRAGDVCVRAGEDIGMVRREDEKKQSLAVATCRSLYTSSTDFPGCTHEYIPVLLEGLDMAATG